MLQYTFEVDGLGFGSKKPMPSLESQPLQIVCLSTSLRELRLSQNIRYPNQSPLVKDKNVGAKTPSSHEDTIHRKVGSCLEKVCPQFGWKLFPSVLIDIKRCVPGSSMRSKRNYAIVLMAITRDSHQIFLYMGPLRFEKDYLQKDLYAWVFKDPVMLDKPVQFQPKGGCQKFMLVDEDFWRTALCAEDQPTSEPVLLITLGAEETQSIINGEQQYLLRSQRVGQTGRVNLAVKSLGFCVLGSVEFSSVQEFKLLRSFKNWEGLELCNPQDVQTGGAMFKRLTQGKSIYAVKLVCPQRAKEPMYWNSPVLRIFAEYN